MSMNQKEQIISPLSPESSQKIRDHLVSTNAHLETRLSSMTSEEKSRYDIQRENITQTTSHEYAQICTICQTERQSLLSEVKFLESAEQEQNIQVFLENYDQCAHDIIFSDLSSFIQIDNRVIEKFAQFHAENPCDERFHFDQLPDSWYDEHMNTSQGIEELLRYAKNTDQLSYLVTRICSYTDIPQDRKEEACTRFISSDSSSENRDIISCLLSTVQNSVVVVNEENYETLLKSLEDATLTRKEKQEIRRELTIYGVLNQKDPTVLYSTSSPLLGHIAQVVNSQISSQEKSNLISPEPPTHLTPQETRQTLAQDGFDFNVSDNEKDQEGFTVRAKHGNILISESLDGTKLAVSGLGFRNEYENNAMSMPYLISNAREYVDFDRHFGLFGNNLADMLNILNSQAHIHNLPTIEFNTKTLNHTLMSHTDKENFYRFFQRIGYFGLFSDISDIETITADRFQLTMEHIEENQHRFFLNRTFSQEEFQRSIITAYIHTDITSTI